MRLATIFILVVGISNTAHAKCLYNIPIRIDKTYSVSEIGIIKSALITWEKASNGRICFEPSVVYIHPEEMIMYNFDGFSTIYNNNLWQILIAVGKYKCILSCVGITTKGKTNDEPPDIFIVFRYHLLHLVTHEVGHLLGFPHSENRKDIMYGYVREDNKISTGDKEVLECLIRNKKILTWKNSCKYKGKKDVDYRTEQNKIGYIKD